MSTAAPATTGTWRVDAATSRAQFRVRDVLHRPVVGTLPVLGGTVRLADGAVSVEAELDLTAVDTGVPRRDRDLQGPRFFATTTSPVLRFVGGPGETLADGSWRLPGRLLLRGTAVAVDVAVEVEDTTDGLRVTARTELDRAEAGITVPRLLVGRRVAVEVVARLVPQARP